jgi:poly-gamma-glutamate capsule biosynthesis protein CapA/YwtB (metallophosphatase superfamily)
MGDVPIIYSLGNLLFDQHFSKAVDTGNIAEFEMVKLNDKVKITQSKIYETSLASKRGIDVDFSPVDF